MRPLERVLGNTLSQINATIQLEYAQPGGVRLLRVRLL